MSLQAAEELGPNAVVCYFPWFPYYQRYQIGFDIFVDPSDAEGDPSVASQSQRLIHVRLEFPDGFICGPATFGGMQHSLFSRNGAPHVSPPQARLHPPMYPDFPDAASQFQHEIPMDVQDPMIWPGEHDVRMKLYVKNGNPGDFVVIDDTPYDVIRQCKQCYEFHREPYQVQYIWSQDDPERGPSQKSHKQSGRSEQHPSTSGKGRSGQHPSTSGKGRSGQHLSTSGKGGSGQHPSTSGTTGQNDMSHAAPYAATKHDFRVPKKRVLTTYPLNLPQQSAGEPQYKPDEGFQGMKPKNYTVFSGETTAVNNEELPLAEGGQKNDGKAVQRKKKHSAKKGVDKATQMDD